MTIKSYPPPCRNFLQPFYLSVTLYACAQRGYTKWIYIVHSYLSQSIMERQINIYSNICTYLQIFVPRYK